MPQPVGRHCDLVTGSSSVDPTRSMTGAPGKRYPPPSMFTGGVERWMTALAAAMRFDCFTDSKKAELARARRAARSGSKGMAAERKPVAVSCGPTTLRNGRSAFWPILRPVLSAFLAPL